ncbi:MAG: hypothetical protein LBL00_07850 [Endomicrobium sp.]|jgi:hypothetical protein|nr:hypothetical protein [Endomicrobium sp.]
MWLALAGTLLSALGQYQQGQAQAAYYDYAAKSAELQGDAQIKAAQFNNLETLKSAASEQAALDKDTARLVGEQKAIMGASGIDASSITFEDVVRDTFKTAKEDEIMLRDNVRAQTALTDMQAKMDKIALQNQAMGFRFSGQNAQTAANTGAASSILGGLGEYSRYKSANRIR